MVLMHAKDASSSAKTLCSLLQVSGVCRRAVQQSVGHCYPRWYGEGALMREVQFAAWLPWYAGLVTGLHLSSLITTAHVRYVV